MKRNPHPISWRLERCLLSDFSPKDSNQEFVKVIHDGVPVTCCAKEGTSRADYIIILSQPPKIGCSISSIISNEVFLTDGSVGCHKLVSVTFNLRNMDCIRSPHLQRGANSE